MQEIGIALKPTRSGAIVFNVAELSLDEAAQAAQDLQVLSVAYNFQHARQSHTRGFKHGTHVQQLS